MYEIVIRIHIIISSLFYITAAIVVSWSIIGWVKNFKASRTYNRFSFVFIHVLYLQLITGVTLYFFLKPEAQSAGLSIEEAALQSSLRFWAIEHVSLMLFALILSQIGRLLIKNITSDRKKFRAATLYFGVSFIGVFASAAMALFR